MTTARTTADIAATATSGLAAKVPTSRTVSAAGIATGGGALSADCTITVPAASQAEAEAGSDNTKAMTPLRTAQAIAALAGASVFHPKAYYFAKLTPTAIPGSCSSVNTGTDIVTWSTAHGFAAGDIIPVWTNTSTPSGLNGNSWYWARAQSTTTFSFHTTRAAAAAGTGLVNLTTTTTGCALRYYLASSVVTGGMQTAFPCHPIADGAASPNVNFEFDFASALSTADGVCAELSIRGFPGFDPLFCYPPSTLTTLLAKWISTDLIHIDTSPSTVNPSGWVTPITGSTAFHVAFKAWY